jgi:hypothetical protein
MCGGCTLEARRWCGAPYDSHRLKAWTVTEARALCTPENVWEQYWFHLQATDSENSDERLLLPPG